MKIVNTISMRIAVLWFVVSPTTLFAQRTTSPNRVSDSLVFPTDNRVLKRFQDAKDYFTQSQWSQGLEILERTVERFPDVMVPVGSRRYISVFTYRNLLVKSLPADGLAVYRQRVDSEAQLWLQAARKNRDPNPLQKILKNAFVSSYGDEALELLGGMAWEQGLYQTARYYWEQIFPASEDPETDISKMRLFYPDSNLNLAELRARCILSLMMQKDWLRAKLELSEFRQKHPLNKGYLAGSKGILSEKLDVIFNRLKSQKPLRTFDENITFAGNPNRNRSYDFHQELKSAFWEKTLEQKRTLSSSQLDFSYWNRLPVSFPVVYRKNVFHCDAHSIWALNLLTGEPAWENGIEDNGAEIFQSPDFAQKSKSRVRSLETSQYTLAVYNGKLYARIGNPITHWNSTELRVNPSSIVCLDIEDGEGRLLWSRSSTDFIGKWSFVGTPVIVDGCVYQILRQSHPQQQTHIVCIDSMSGKTLWKQKIYSMISSGNIQKNRIAPNLLTYGNGKIFLSTEQGGVIAINAETGILDWVLTKPEMENGNDEFIRTDHVMKPLLFYKGRIYASFPNSDFVLCMESSSGILLWKQRVPDRILHILGAGYSGLIVSGRHLWCLDVETGNINWHGPIFKDPVGHSFGRGFLTDKTVYWPTRNRIFMFDLQTGEFAAPAIPIGNRNTIASGGNLLPTASGLLIAEPRRLVFYPSVK